MYGNDILSVIFLAIICVIVASIIVKYTPNQLHLVVPSVALISIILWVCYDYIIQKREKNHVHHEKKPNIQQLINAINNAEDEDDREQLERGMASPNVKHFDIEDTESITTDSTNDHEEGQPKDPKLGAIQDPWYLKNKNKEALKLVKFAPNEFDIDYYGDPTKEVDIRMFYNEMGGDTDNAICNRAKYQGMQAKLSQDIRTLFNKHSAEPYYQAELKEQEDRYWYEADDNTYGPL